jgi:Fe2+ or Zn2+ uptake regulation protein
MGDPTHEDVLQFVRENSKPFVKSVEVSERFDSVSRRTVNKRLNQLRERGALEKTEIGANGVVWWLPSQASEAAKRSRPASDSQ